MNHPNPDHEPTDDEIALAVVAILRRIADGIPPAPSIYDRGQPLHDLKESQLNDQLCLALPVLRR